MADFRVMSAADELEQRAVRPSVGKFERIEIVERREFLSPRIDSQ
jgi:hypothetical protein